jgi:hypothetical protein
MNSLCWDIICKEMPDVKDSIKVSIPFAIITFTYGHKKRGGENTPSLSIRMNLLQIIL